MRVFAFYVAGMMAASCLFAGPGRAHADTERTFAVSGLFRSGAVMSGTLTVDADSGVVVSCDVRVSGTKTVIFGRVARQTVIGMAAVVELAPAAENWPRLIFGEQTFPGSLRGYMGGPMGRRTDILRRNGTKELILSGHLVAEPAGSPELRCPVPVLAEQAVTPHDRAEANRSRPP